MKSESDSPQDMVDGLLKELNLLTVKVREQQKKVFEELAKGRSPPARASEEATAAP